MSLSSESRKERTDSHAAQQAETTQGIDPNLDTLHSSVPVQDLPSQSHTTDDVEQTDVEPIEDKETASTDAIAQKKN